MIEQLNVPITDLDFYTLEIRKREYLKTEDMRSRYRRYRLLYGGNPIELSGVQAKVYMRKPDGHEVWNHCTIKGDNTVIVEFTSQALAVPGVLKVEIVLTDAETSFELSSFVLDFEVLMSVRTDTAIESGNEVGILNELIGYFEAKKLEIDNLVTTSGTRLSDLIAEYERMQTEWEAHIFNVNEETDIEIANMLNTWKAFIDKTNTDTTERINAMTTNWDNHIKQVNDDTIKRIDALIAKWDSQFNDKYTGLEAEYAEALANAEVVEQTEQGSYLTFTNSVEASISDVELLGATHQDLSTLEITSSGIPQDDGTFKMSILSVNKNLNFTELEIGDLSDTTGEEVVDTHTRSDFIRINGLLNCFVKCMDDGIKFDKVILYDKNKKFLKKPLTNQSEQSIQIPSNAYYLRFVVYGSKSQDFDFVRSNIQIEEGTIATPFIQSESNKSDILLSSPLDSIGDVKDRVYFDTVRGKWCIEKNVEIVFYKDLTNISPCSANAHYWFVQGTYMKNGEAVTIPNYTGRYDTILSNVPFSHSYEERIHVWYDRTSGTFRGAVPKSEVRELDQVLEYFRLNNWFMMIKSTNPQIMELSQDMQIILNSYAEKTHIWVESGLAQALIKATVAKSLGAVAEGNREAIELLESRVTTIEGLKESQELSYSAEGSLVCKNTKVGTVKDLKIYGRTLVNRFAYANDGSDDTLVKEIICEDSKNLNYGKFTIPNISDKPIAFNICNKANDGFIQSITVPPHSNYVIDLDAKNAYLYNIVGNVSDGWTSCAELKQIAMFIEGVCNFPITTYFERMKSVGEDVNEIEVLTTDNKLDSELIEDRKTILYLDTITKTWKPIPKLCGKWEYGKQVWGDVVDSVRGKWYKRTDTRGYQRGDESNQEVITDMTNTVYQLEKEEVYDISPLSLDAYVGETRISCSSGAIPATMDFKIVSSINSYLQSVEKRVDRLEELVVNLHAMVASADMYAMRGDTLLKESQVTQDTMLVNNDMRLMALELNNGGGLK